MHDDLSPLWVEVVGHSLIREADQGLCGSLPERRPPPRVGIGAEAPGLALEGGVEPSTLLGGKEAGVPEPISVEILTPLERRDSLRLRGVLAGTKGKAITLSN